MGRGQNMHGVQMDWLTRNAGKPITLRLMDGTRVSGILVGFDMYTTEIRVAGRGETVLINKHAIALFMRREERDDEEKSRGTGGG
jgi:sRNA-binding regulator protein Hfq